MAHRRSSIKKIRIDKRRRLQNLRVISELKTFARKAKQSVDEKKHDEALTTARELFSKIDKAVKKGIVHRNVANRRKSRLTLAINALAKRA